MDYRIISADAVQGQIQVTYTKDGVDIATYAIDVPIEDGKYITGVKLDAEIQSRAPIWLLQRQARVAAAEDFQQIQSLVQSDQPVTINNITTRTNEAKSLNEEEITALVYRILDQIEASKV